MSGVDIGKGAGLFFISLLVLCYIQMSPAQEFQNSCVLVLNAATNTNGVKGTASNVDLMKIYDSAPDKYMPLPENAPWAANYFPMDEGGIASRWQTGEKGNYDLLSLGTKGKLFKKQSILKKQEVIEKLKDMTQDERNQLSPTEKYDILIGDYMFQTTLWELENRGPLRDPKPKHWEGFCNAMRAAGFIIPEPKSRITVTNKDGIDIVLEIADLKALIGATYFYVEKYAALGSPSMVKPKDGTPPDAGAFHIALNYLAKYKKLPMVIDADQGIEIWNESVVGYERKMGPPRDPLPKDREVEDFPDQLDKVVDVNMSLTTLIDVDNANTNRVNAAEVAQRRLGNRSIQYSYKLYIDAKKSIVGGDWINGRWPDFVWFPAGRGTDAENDGNPYLKYNTVVKWVEKSSQ